MHSPNEQVVLQAVVDASLDNRWPNVEVFRIYTTLREGEGAIGLRVSVPPHPMLLPYPKFWQQSGTDPTGGALFYKQVKGLSAILTASS